MRTGSGIIDLRSQLSDHAPMLARAGHPLPARVVRLEPGKTELDLAGQIPRDCFGIMVIDGLMLAEAEAGRAHTAWLVGEHDLVRPSAMREIGLTEETRWRALTPTQVALLDYEFGQRAAGMPLVYPVLLTLVTRTSSWLFAKSLILSSPGVEERLLLLFALLGERWGKVTPEGVLLRLPLTHAILALLCGTRRPSVTVALHALERDGLLRCSAKGVWLLQRGGSTGSSTPACVSCYERALGLN
jgi:hypothetical protein